MWFKKHSNAFVRDMNIVMELGALKSIEETISVQMQCFLPIRTNFVKNIKP